MKQLAGKVIVVTGAAGGIGHALAMQLSIKHRSKIWAIDVNGDALDKLCDDASKYGGAVEPIIADVGEYLGLKRARDLVLAQERQLDIWINNAGIVGLGGFTERSIKDFNQVINVNLCGVANGTHLALDTMEARAAGVIVNIASIAGHVPAPFMAAYVASKHGVVGLTRSIRRELQFADSHVRLMLVSPGYVKTEMIESHATLKFPEWLQWTLSTPTAVAKAIIRAIRSGKDEITPTLNGQFMRSMHKLMPETTERGSKLFLSNSWKDVLLNRFDR